MAVHWRAERCGIQAELRRFPRVFFKCGALEEGCSAQGYATKGGAYAVP